MRGFGLLVVAFSLLLSLALAWEKLDHEIFELYDDIKRNENTTDWYELLGVPPKGSVDEINQAYRKLSRKYHPDKLRRLPDAKAQEKRFQRLSLVVNILRDKESRKRYNFFRKNGVPVWRGTGYLYRRYRPGLGSVLVGLLAFASGMQYLFHALSYWRAQQRIRDLEEHRSQTGGRLKVGQDEPSARQSGRRMRRRQKAANGNGSLTNTDREDSGVEGGEEIDPLQVNTVGVINPYAVKPASISRVLIVRLPMGIVTAALVLAGLRQRPAEEPEEEETEGGQQDEDGQQGEGFDQAVARAIDNASGVVYQPDPAAKAKKAARKAAKAEARRRRTPVV
ncbi:hypothetical protein GGF46_004711 [Coemansia sp. RSA 552]|nr:hypothetical protein GGF46_004711 [Coemansia sp. RSA 552]